MKRSRLITIIIIIVCLGTIVNLSRSIYSLWKRSARIKQREIAYEKAKEENDKLKHKLAEIETVEYIEKQARDKLGLSKSGEYVVMLPESLKQVSSSQSGRVQGSYKPQENWKAWLELFY